MYGGYVGKILRVDLSSGSFKELSTWDYVPDFIGGAGIGFKILWDETNKETNEWSPENTLVFVSGPCSGTPAIASSRTTVVGLSALSYPIPWAIFANFGGNFAPKMKWAGYDAIVVTGKATSPKYLYVSENGSHLEDAEFLRGMTTYATQSALGRRHGTDIAIACIGPAGENRVRWSIILSHTQSACGSSGFGAVMGDKNLKAIVVKPGNHKIEVARPDKLIEEVVKLTSEMAPAGQNQVPLVADRGRYTDHLTTCSMCGVNGTCMCPVDYYSNVPRRYTGSGTVSGIAQCLFHSVDRITDGKDPRSHTGPEFERNFEFAVLQNELGLDQFEVSAMALFWNNCYNAGKLTSLLGEKVELNKNAGPWPKKETHCGLSPQFAAKFLNSVAYREGEGDIWAEASPRAADIMGLDDQVWKTHKHGYMPHWDGRYGQGMRYPMWIIMALQWAMAGRNAAVQDHCLPKAVCERGCREWWTKSLYGKDQISYPELVKAGAKLYRAEHALAGWDKPEFGYLDKEYPVIYHEYRRIIKACVPVCDKAYRFAFDIDKPDHIADKEFELRQFNAVVGTDWTLDDMHKACERVLNLERAIRVRQGRTRANDESVIPFFEQPAPFPDEPGPQTLEVSKFKELMDRYYVLRGWDNGTGWPTRAKLEELGLKYVADELASIGKLPR